jgi:hypothetical protein
MKINKKIVMPGMRRKVTFVKLKFFRIERRRREEEEEEEEEEEALSNIGIHIDVLLSGGY